MLHSEFIRRSDSRPMRFLAFLLGEAFLGFLAIVATALTLFPMLFSISENAASTLDAIQWGIVALFAAEYLLALVWSEDKRAFLLNPWRLLDLATILVPLATLLPSVSDLLRSSLLLRLVRLVRIVTFSVRASGLIARNSLRDDGLATAKPRTQVTLVGARSDGELAWPDFLERLRKGQNNWFHIQHPSEGDLAAIAKEAGTSLEALRAHLAGTGFPHVETLGDNIGFFLWTPEFQAGGEVGRTGLYFLMGTGRVLSFSQACGRTGAPSLARPSAEGPQSFAEGMAKELFRSVILRNEQIVGLYAQEIRALEEVPLRESRTSFFEKTFRLKKELAAAQSDLWRLRSLLTELADGRARIPGAEGTPSTDFKRMADDAAYLHETLLNLREEVLSLIELHINVVSFDMNRVMRVLAVISALGLIPSVVGGLLGMNLADNPWPMTLPQVAFGVCFGMVVGLYLFFIKGWLR